LELEISVETKRRIGILVDSLVGGGAERISLNFAEKLISLGHDAHVIILRNEIEHDVRAVPVHALSENGQLSSSRFINKRLLVSRLRKTLATISAVDGKPFDFFISSSEDMDRLSQMAKLPYVFVRYRNSMLHFISAKIGRSTGLKRQIRTFRWFRKFRRIYGDRHIVTVSKALEHELLNDIGLKPKSIRTIYNPFNFEKIRSLAKEPVPVPDVPYIVYAARISGRKGQKDLVRAYAKSNVSHHLVLLGGTTDENERVYQDELEVLIKELGLEEKVHLPGFAKNPYPWIKHASLFAMASLSEGLPTVLIESLILGTPVVSTDCPTGPSEILVGSLSGFLSPVGDIDKLAGNIISALSDYPEITEDKLYHFSDSYALNQYIKHFESLCCISEN
jgi:glycosyltransferase involved in cell wall biosynthesis